MKLKTIAAGLMAAGFSGALYAAPLLPMEGFFEDNNIEYVTDANGAVKTSGALAVGDTLWAVVGFEAIRNADNSIFLNLNQAGGPELTGISALQITSIVGNKITFGANSSFEAQYGTGALAALYYQNPGDFDVGCTSRAACTTAATNGSLWMVAGLGDATDVWEAETTAIATGADLATIAGLTATTKVAVANYGLSVLTNNTGYQFGQQFCAECSDLSAQIVGSGDVLGGRGLTNGFLARSDFDFNFARVPVPGTAALLGLGFLGVGWFSRREKK